MSDPLEPTQIVVEPLQCCSLVAQPETQRDQVAVAGSLIQRGALQRLVALKPLRMLRPLPRSHLGEPLGVESVSERQAKQQRDPYDVVTGVLVQPGHEGLPARVGHLVRAAVPRTWLLGLNEPAL